jgi:hypothetical protein
MNNIIPVINPITMDKSFIVPARKSIIIEDKSRIVEIEPITNKKNNIIKKETQIISIKPTNLNFKNNSKITNTKIIKKTIVFLGSQYRCPSIIYKLNLPDFTKIWLPGRTESYAKQILNQECIEYNISLTDEELNSVIIKHLNDTEYDDLLINSYVILNQFTSSANNALLECIALNIPIFCNRLPAVEEYIGKDYPLFFKDIDDLEKLIYNADKIKEAYEYIANMNVLNKKLELDTFMHDILNSNITRSILR